MILRIKRYYRYNATGGIFFTLYRVDKMIRIEMDGRTKESIEIYRDTMLEMKELKQIRL